MFAVDSSLVQYSHATVNNSRNRDCKPYYFPIEYLTSPFFGYEMLDNTNYEYSAFENLND